MTLRKFGKLAKRMSLANDRDKADSADDRVSNFVDPSSDSYDSDTIYVSRPPLTGHFPGPSGKRKIKAVYRSGKGLRRTKKSKRLGARDNTNVPEKKKIVSAYLASKGVIEPLQPAEAATARGTTDTYPASPLASIASPPPHQGNPDIRGDEIKWLKANIEELKTQNKIDALEHFRLWTANNALKSKENETRNDLQAQNNELQSRLMSTSLQSSVPAANPFIATNLPGYLTNDTNLPGDLTTFDSNYPTSWLHAQAVPSSILHLN